MPRLSASEAERAFGPLLHAIVRDSDRSEIPKAELFGIINRGGRFARPYFDGILESFQGQSLLQLRSDERGELTLFLSWDNIKRLESYVRSLNYDEEQAATDAGLVLIDVIAEISGPIDRVATPTGANAEVGVGSPAVAAVPASDRVVRLDDNSPGRAEAIEGLGEIERAIRGRPNDLALSAEERDVALSQVTSLSARLKSRFVRLGEIASEAAGSGFLRWLRERLGDHALAHVVDRVLSALTELLRALV